MHQIRFRRDLDRGAYSAPPDLLAGIRGSTFKVRGWKGERKGRGRGNEGEGREREGRPPYANFWISQRIPIVGTVGYTIESC